MPNLGAAPLDPETPVGQLRANLGDTGFTELEPPVAGQVDYANFSDAALEAFLAGASGNVARATGAAYMQLAAIYAAAGKSIKTDDLAHDDRQRGADLFEVAKWWFSHADAAEAAAAAEIFEIAPFAGRAKPRSRPEGTPWPQGI